MKGYKRWPSVVNKPVCFKGEAEALSKQMYPKTSQNMVHPPAQQKIKTEKIQNMNQLKPEGRNARGGTQFGGPVGFFCSGRSFKRGTEGERFNFFCSRVAIAPTCYRTPKPPKLGIPWPQTGPNPHLLEKRASGSQNPRFLSPLHMSSVQKCPFSMCPLVEKKGIFDRKLPFPGWGEMGVFLDPETLFSRKWGFGPLSGVRGIPTRNPKNAF